MQSGDTIDPVDGELARAMAMSAEEFVEWFLSEPDPVPLSSFPLQTDEGRKEFLREYVRRGEPALFEAVGAYMVNAERAARTPRHGDGHRRRNRRQGKWP